VAKGALLLVEVLSTCVIGLIGVMVGTGVHWFLAWELSSFTRPIGLSNFYLHELTFVPYTVFQVLRHGGWTYGVGILYFYPAFFTSGWALTYVLSGVLVAALRRLDFDYQYFARKVDIEKKPLQVIGFITGVLVALAYWTVIIVSHIV
jgi:hypothetical protein